MKNNFDLDTVNSFGDEWSRFDQSKLSEKESHHIFEQYFSIFPWKLLPVNAEGFDMGCGSGRWAKLVAPRVGCLNCIDASAEALHVARYKLSDYANVNFFHASLDATPLNPASQDFGYSLGVLHHIPNTTAAIESCAKFLKPGAPFFVYIYYRFDNRPAWFSMVWQATELLRAVISRLPNLAKSIITDVIALTVYWPISRFAWVLGKFGRSICQIPLSFYANKSLYTMRTDSRDRFGTPLEQRFTRQEIQSMMEKAGLTDIRFSDNEPYWCAVGIKT